MINRKIAMSAMSILTALGMTAGATFAFFSDTATSTANTFAAGSLDLQVDDNNEAATQTVTASLVGSGMLPGGTPTTGFISLHNGGGVSIAEIEMSTTVTETADPDGNTFLGDVINVSVLSGDDSTCTTGQVDHTGTLATVIGNGNSPLTLSELNGSTYDSFPGLAPAGDKYICMSAQMDASANNLYQGDAVSVDFAFTGNQDASQ